MNLTDGSDFCSRKLPQKPPLPSIPGRLRRNFIKLTY